MKVRLEISVFVSSPFVSRNSNGNDVFKILTCRLRLCLETRTETTMKMEISSLETLTAAALLCSIVGTVCPLNSSFIFPHFVRSLLASVY